MTILNPTGITGKVEAILVNDGKDDDSIATMRIPEVAVSFEGFAGERHSSLVTMSDVRFRKQYARDTPIRNTRQVSMLSVEDLRQIAGNLDVEQIEPEWLGANLVVSGIARFTELPPSSRLLFSSGAALVIDNQNAPCRYPADIVERHHPGAGAKFIDTAKDLRGLVGWVEREGSIALGDEIALHIPPQRIYTPRA